MIQKTVPARLWIMNLHKGLIPCVGPILMDAKALKIMKGLFIGACLAALILSACGGGGSGGGNDTSSSTSGSTSTGSGTPPAGVTPPVTTPPVTTPPVTTPPVTTPPVTTPPVTTPPVIPTQSNAGSSQTVLVGTLVSLDGSASTVSTGRTLAYAWTFIAPSGHALSAANTAHASFNADTAGVFTVELAVNDGVTTSTSRVSVTAVAATSSITAAFTPSRRSGVAPLAVFFDATATTAVGISKPFHDLEYQWNFGETGLGNWGQGARANALSRNVDSGPVASHVFETPGTYTVTLNATDGSNVGSQSIQITVTDPNTVFASTTACISTSGTFTGCPTGATTLTTSDFASAINSHPSIRRFLFRRGETWTSANAAEEIQNGPGIIGAYGTGAAPKWRVNPSASLLLSSRTTPTISDWRVMDIEFDGQNLSTSGVQAGGAINQVLLLRLNIHDVNVGVQFDVSLIDYWNGDNIAADHGHGMWDQLAVVDSRVNNIDNGVGISNSTTASGGIGAYISAARLSLMGNSFDAVGGGEHVLRTPYIGKGVVSHNYLARPDAAKHCFKLHAPGFTGTSVVSGRYSEQIVVADNTFFGGLSVETVKIAPQNSAYDERIRDVILERNYFLMGSGSEFGLVVSGPVTSLSARNNVINASNSNNQYPAHIAISGEGTGATSQVTIYNNTLYSSKPYFQAVTVVGSASLLSGIAVKNNLAYAPAAASAGFLSNSGGSAVVSSNNSTDAQTRSTSPQFQTIPGPTLTSLVATDFKPAAASYVVGAGISLPVRSDLYGVGRAAGAPMDLGAVAH